MNIPIEVRSVAIDEKPKKIESGWTICPPAEMQLFFEFFDTGSAEPSLEMGNVVPPAE